MKIDREMRKVAVPAHRYTPLRENWEKIYKPINDFLHLQIKFNLQTRYVEIRTCPETTDVSNLNKAEDFVKAFVYGFDVDDAIALLRMDHLFLDSFHIHDVKRLMGDHLSRAIGRISGKHGRTKHMIENATKTRIVLADSKIHIMGSFNNIKATRRLISNLIMGSSAQKVTGSLQRYAKYYSLNI